MENSEDANVTELAEALRCHVERRGHSTMSSESIAAVGNILTELSATLREELNSRIPLFQLPVEIQQKILEHVPDPLSKSHGEFRPSWHSSAMDTSMLRPVLQTCRQFRRIALSHVFLWKTISPTQEFALPPILLRKSCDIPLIAVIDGSWGDEPEVLGSLDEVDAHRMQELHLFDLDVPHLRDNITAKIHEYFKTGLPLLESLSLCRVSTRDEEEDEDEDEDEDGDEDTSTSEDKCPFSLDDVPRLRHMMLQAVTFIPSNRFPHLTHLALSDIDTSDCHTEIARLLSHCPNLESLSIWHPYILDPPLDLPEDFPHSLTLNRLHRVTLQLPQFHADIMNFYLSFFPQDDSIPQPTALQILDLALMDNVSALREMLLRITKAEASHLSLTLHPYARSRYRYLSISAAGPKGTFHISTECFQDMGVQPQEESDVSPKRFLDSILPSCAHLRAVREVWVTAMPAPPGRPSFRDAMEHSRLTIAALPALETIVLVVTVVRAQLEVDLGLCPSAHDPGFASPNLKTLRIVHGNEELTRRGPVEKIRLTSLLDQVRTGAYGYFENVLLEMTRRLVVDGKDLARLRARFRRVTFQHIHSMPTMPLPEYCTEPYAGSGGSSTWHGSLW